MYTVTRFTQVTYATLFYIQIELEVLLLNSYVIFLVTFLFN